MTCTTDATDTAGAETPAARKARGCRAPDERVNGEQTLTMWGRADEPVHGSAYGQVTYLEWCSLECARINRRGGLKKARIETNSSGEIAVYRPGIAV